MNSRWGCRTECEILQHSVCEQRKSADETEQGPAVTCVEAQDSVMSREPMDRSQSGREEGSLAKHRVQCRTETRLPFLVALTRADPGGRKHGKSDGHEWREEQCTE